MIERGLVLGAGAPVSWFSSCCCVCGAPQRG